jgi:acetylornithine/succinyldiaminopimelate/putrescine aminotransferase
MGSPLAQTYATLPFTVARGEGMYVFDTDGNRYLDLYGGHAVAVLGHSPPEVARAIAEQAATLLFYSNVAPIEVRDRAAARLLAFAGGHFEQVFFCNSGAEANENALKLAIQKTGRSKLVALKGSFHGRTLLASAVTDNPKWHEQTHGWMGPVSFIAPNGDLGEIDDQTAAVIVEPIQSMAGVVVLSSNYLSDLRRQCDLTGALLVFDEVQTGMGRTGTPFASGFRGVVPDMGTSAKGLASGVPMGALLLTERLAKQVVEGDLGSTFGGGPLACAAMEATISVIERDGLAANAARFEKLVRAMNVKGIEEVVGEGALLGLRLAEPAKEAHKRLLERRVITGTSKDPHVLRLLPPLIAGEEHVNELAAAFGT